MMERSDAPAIAALVDDMTERPQTVQVRLPW